MKSLLGWLPAMCAAAFPLHPRATTPILIVWLIVLLAVLATERFPMERTKPRFVWWAGALFYALILLGSCWSENVELAVFALEVKVSLLLLPVMFWLTEQHVGIDRNRIAWGLIAGLGVAAVGSWGIALWNSILNLDHSGWRYAGLSSPLHPTYASWYWAFGMSWLLHDRRKWWIAPAALAGGLMLGLLSSKAGWIGGGGVFLWAILANRNRWAAAAGALTLILSAWGVGQNRMAELAEGMHAAVPSEQHVQSGSTAGRLQSWSAARHVILEHPFGVGTGDVVTALDECYRETAAEYAGKHHMNAHNAFLEAGVAFGWFGLFFLVVWWARLAQLGWQKRDEMALIYTLLMAWFALTESVFELQSGVVWIAFGCCVWSVRK
jgi:O-antigen ligase